MVKKRGYHHGNLRQALIDAALQLIEVRGPTGFTLAEAAKQAGVTPAAVYRHFVGREDLIAERVAIESYSEIIRWLGEKDSTTRRMLEDILSMEEEHANDLLSILEDMNG